MAVGAVDWERTLADEGLAPMGEATLANGREARKEKREGNTTAADLVPLADKREAVASYLAWAREVLDAYPFSTRTRRLVWELHAGGATWSEIVVASASFARNTRALSRRQVTRIIAEVKHAHLPPPVTNPWRKSGRREPELAGVGNMRELLGGVTMAAAVVQYSRIRVRKGFEVRIPGAPLPKDMLIPGKGETFIEGRPHAGGIDVTFGDHVVTVPWWKVEEAVRAGEAV